MLLILAAVCAHHLLEAVEFLSVCPAPLMFLIVYGKNHQIGLHVQVRMNKVNFGMFLWNFLKTQTNLLIKISHGANTKGLYTSRKIVQDVKASHKLINNPIDRSIDKPNCYRKPNRMRVSIFCTLSVFDFLCLTLQSCSRHVLDYFLAGANIRFAQFV